MKISKTNIALVITHLFILLFLFTYRYPPSQAYTHLKEWDEGKYSGKIQDYIKLYYSDPSDEAYYYEWSTLVLGKSFEGDYPLEKRNNSRVSYLFHEPSHTRLPYLQIEFEYPPTVIAPLLLARLVSIDYLSFTKVLALIFSTAYLVCLWLTWKLWNKISEPHRLKWNSILGLSALFIFSLGQLFVTRMDVLATLMTLLCLYSFVEKKYLFSSFWGALGALTKGFPILLAPLFAIKLIYERKWKALAFSTLFFIFLLVGTSLVLSSVTQGAYWDSFKYHAERGIQIESLWALIPFWKHLLLGTPILVYNAYTCSNVTMENPDILFLLSKYTGPLLFLLIYILYTKNVFQKKDSLFSLISASLALIFAFMLSFKALSPQYLIWIVPLLFVTPYSTKKWFLFLVILSAILTQIIFPNFYELLYQAEWGGIFLLSARNLILLILFTATLCGIGKSKTKEEGLKS